MLRQILPQITFLASAAVAGIAVSARALAAEPPRVSGPFVHENLAVYFLHGPSAEGPVPLTLDEALEKGSVKVHETGTVAELRIENVGSDEVLVHAGDIVKGGQQDRVVTTSFILKPGSGPTPLAVFCVEAGRWAARGNEDVKAFASASEMLPSRRAKLSLRAGYARPAAPPSVAASAREAGAREEVPSDEIAQRANVEPRQQRLEPSGGANTQSEIWKEVGNIQAALSSSLGAKVAADESETSLQLALENEKLQKARAAYIDDLEPKGAAESDIVGLVFAVGGKLNSADVYGSNALFRKLWPKLLKASVTEALSARVDGEAAAAPATAEVETFLTQASAGKEDSLEPAEGIKLKSRESAAAVDYVTERASGTLVHRNVLAK